jgi:hypothetical protein
MSNTSDVNNNQRVQVKTYFSSSSTAYFPVVGVGIGEETHRSRKPLWTTVPIDWHFGSPCHLQVGRAWSKVIDLPFAAFNQAASSRLTVGWCDIQLTKISPRFKRSVQI